MATLSRTADVSGFASADTPADIKQQTTSPRLLTIDALRGIAAASVAWFHFTNGNETFLPHGMLRSSGVRGWVGVEVFFVISGFIIPYSLFRAKYLVRRDWRKFLAKRIVRIDPPYLASIVLTVCLAYLSAATPGFQGKQPQYSLPQLLLHVGYLNGFFRNDWILPVYWTLALEFQFYVLVAISFPLITGDIARRAGFSAAAMLMGVLIAPTVFVFRWMPLFLLGIAAFLYRERISRWREYAITTLTAAAICFWLFGPLIMSVGLVAALLIAFVELRQGNRLALLGTISYSIYLVHVPVGGRVVNLGSRLAPTLANRLLVLAAAVALTLLVSVLFYRFVEKPSQRLSSRVRYGSR